MIARPAVEASGVSKRFGSRDALRDVDFIARHGRAARSPRSERCRQNHADARPARTGPARRRDPCVSSAATSTRRRHHCPTGSRRSSTRPPSIRTCRGAPTSRCSLVSTATHAAVPARVDRALEQTGLAAQADDAVGGYSAGMRQRLGLAAALIRSPQLLFLDEPTSALDPAGARDVRALARRLADEGAAVVLSSHDMAEVEELCTMLTVINDGRVVFSGSVDELRTLAPGRRARAANQRRLHGAQLSPLSGAREGDADRRRRSRSVGRDRRARRLRHRRSDAPASPSAIWSAARDRSNRCSSSSRAQPIRNRSCRRRLTPNRCTSRAWRREPPRYPSTVAGVEWSKLLAQLKVRLVLAACVDQPVRLRGGDAAAEQPADRHLVRAIGHRLRFRDTAGRAGVCRALGVSRSRQHRRRGCVFGRGPLRHVVDRAHAIAQSRRDIRRKGADRAGLLCHRSRDPGRRAASRPERSSSGGSPSSTCRASCFHPGRRWRVSCSRGCRFCRRSSVSRRLPCSSRSSRAAARPVSDCPSSPP